MSSAILRLESFATSPRSAAITPGLTTEDLDQAFADGLAEGLARKDDEELRALRAGIERLQESLNEDEARRTELRRDAVRALAPLLTQILDSLASAETSRRLEQTLTLELSRIAQAATPLRATIACSARMRDLVQRCVTESGANGVLISESESDLISLSLQGGHIEFSTEAAGAEIRRLIQEINEEQAVWTHSGI
ncbi:hypothetical protein JJJ17_03535 [Paracoccus caeni]|uniref:Uncharacterized protein n=1 Tax=Paracoccus caeni TaxID=657651 RepID=A0A934SIC6_9RHOB|nr:hypothetical protein [Paracoccus caeni]MBK4214993.1 hypothetical protein [Paracoccus caeni]